jgi:hypothetical protein
MCGFISDTMRKQGAVVAENVPVARTGFAQEAREVVKRTGSRPARPLYLGSFITGGIRRNEHRLCSSTSLE